MKKAKPDLQTEIFNEIFRTEQDAFMAKVKIDLAIQETKKEIRNKVVDQIYDFFDIISNDPDMLFGRERPRSLYNFSQDGVFERKSMKQGHYTLFVSINRNVAVRVDDDYKPFITLSISSSSDDNPPKFYSVIEFCKAFYQVCLQKKNSN